MASGLRNLATLVFAVLLTLGCNTKQNFITPDPDVGILECNLGQIARWGGCMCLNDTGCQPDEYCDSVTGQCLPKVVKPGADAANVGCTNGARRCAPVVTVADGGHTPGAVQVCQNGIWTDLQDCPEGGYCAESATGYYCAVCANGKSRCKAGVDDTLETCSEIGDQWVDSVCPNDPMTGAPSKCDQAKGRCQSCEPGTLRCSADGKSLETCLPDATGWEAKYCPITGKCIVDQGTPQCVPSVCNPELGEKKCKPGDQYTLMTCADDGLSWIEIDCRHYDKFATPDAVCDPTINDCKDPCAKEARNSSYLGCEYWATVTTNSELDATHFKAGAADGTQPDQPGDYAIVVSNPNTDAVTVRVDRVKGGGLQYSPSDPAADASGAIIIPANGLQAIKLPWQQVAGTGQKAYAYHLVSSLPIAAYQFNPLDAYTGGKKEYTDPTDPTRCTNCAYTNDASLLVPAHILGGDYVVLGQEHITISGEDGQMYGCTVDADCGNNNHCISILGQKVCQNTPIFDVPAFFSIVGTEDNTYLTIKFSAATVASRNGVAIAAQAKGSTGTYSLSKYDVLQFLSGVDSGNPAECYNYPAGTGFGKACRYNSDPTGTIIAARDVTDPKVVKSVAVFSGADCSFKPYNKFACDHLEEMMLPFSTWGSSYAGVKTAPYKTSGGSPVSNPAPDYWRVVAGCGTTSCPQGTHFTINPPPAQILAPGNKYCTGSICTLPPIDASAPTAAWLEFTHAGDFTVIADKPIMLSQYFTGEEANSGSAEGDPSLVLTPPIEQWRTSYNVLTAPTLVHNYLSLVTQSATPGIFIDGLALNSANFPGMDSRAINGQFPVYVVPVKGGAHQIKSTAKVGVTIYGYDSYVSYGYTGGLDLVQITQIIPGQ